jgi:hypothetical protein
MHIPRVLIAMLVAAALSHPAVAQDKSEASEIQRARSELTWAGPDLLFIPQSKLLNADGTLNAAAFRSPRDIDAVNALVAAARSLPPGGCVPHRQRVINDDLSSRTNSSLSQRTLESAAPAWKQRVERAAISLRGTVVAITPGLNYTSLAPAELIQIRVDRLIHQHYGSRREPGRLVSYVTEGGTMTIEGARVCVVQIGEPTLAVGQRIFLSGFPQEDARLPLSLLPATDVLPITNNNEVLVPEGAGTRSPVSLSDIETQIERSAGTMRRRN